MYLSSRAGLVGTVLLFSLVLSAAAPIPKEKLPVSASPPGRNFPGPYSLTPLPSFSVENVDTIQIHPNKSNTAGRDNELDVQDNILECRGFFHAIKNKFQASLLRPPFPFKVC